MADEMLKKLPAIYKPHDVHNYNYSISYLDHHKFATKLILYIGINPELILTRKISLCDFLCLSLILQVKTRIAIMGSLQPLNIFFKQEIDRMVKVLIAVNSILQDLKLAIEGTIIMNEV